MYKHEGQESKISLRVSANDTRSHLYTLQARITFTLQQRLTSSRNIFEPANHKKTPEKSHTSIKATQSSTCVIKQSKTKQQNLHFCTDNKQFESTSWLQPQGAPVPTVQTYADEVNWQL